MSDDPAADRGDAPAVPLPGHARGVARDHPEVWSAYQRLGQATGKAGPLDERSQRLVHLALAIGADSEGATHSHARRALAEGMTPEEIEHVALIAITTLGWPQAMRGLSWIHDETRKARRG